MTIQMEDGFYQDHATWRICSCLGIESKRMAECIAKISETRIAGVFASPHFGFNGKNLDFLRAIPWVVSISFSDVDLDNIDGLYALEQLRSCGLGKRPPIDFSRFPKLQEAIIEPRTKDVGMDKLLELATLHVWHYRPASKTFSNLGLPASLTELQINWANPASLDSLPALPQLRRLEIHRCRNLEDLGILREKFPNLERLVVTTSKKVTREEAARAIEGLQLLRHATLNRDDLV